MTLTCPLSSLQRNETMIIHPTILNASLACVRLTVQCDKAVTGRDNGFIRWKWAEVTSAGANHQGKHHRGDDSSFTDTLTKEQRKKPFYSTSIYSPKRPFKNAKFLILLSCFTKFLMILHGFLLHLGLSKTLMLWHTSPYRPYHCLPFQPGCPMLASTHFPTLSQKNAPLIFS